MAAVSRRAFLATGLTAGGLLAGCSALPLGGAPPPEERISTETSILAQPTADDPPRIQLRITNETSGEITLSSNDGRPPEVFPRLDGPSGAVVLLPRNPGNDVATEVASTRTNGCWRFVRPDGTETTVRVRAMERRMTLAAKQTHTVAHDLYYEGERTACFPDGEYSATHPITFHDEADERSSPDVELTYTLTITDRSFSHLTVE